VGGAVLIQPIRPDQVAESKKASMPDAVMESFNEEIASKFSGNRSVVMQNEVIARIVARGYQRQEIFANHWLDVEDIYRAAGWNVEYDKPGYNEDYEANFTFTRGKV
jgi:hypothetical protein